MLLLDPLRRPPHHMGTAEERASIGSGGGDGKERGGRAQLRRGVAPDVGAAGVRRSRRARATASPALGAERLKRMHEDYRQAAADLAYAQTHFPASEAAAYLNRLVGQAHGELYGATPRRLATMWRFLAYGYPRLVRRNARPILLATAVLLGAVALGFLLAHVDYPLARLFLPAAYRDVAGDPIAAGTAGRATCWRRSRRCSRPGSP